MQQKCDPFWVIMSIVWHLMILSALLGHMFNRMQEETEKGFHRVRQDMQIIEMKVDALLSKEKR